jgi:nucleoside-diphosphate-sugar epimerase
MEACIRRPAHRFPSLLIPDHRRLVSALLRSPSELHAGSFLHPESAQDWIVAVGLIDPRSDRAELRRVNVDFPLRLLDQLRSGARLGRRRLVTFGSVLENRSDIARMNPYIESKAQLLSSWQELSSGSPITWLHVQLHTLYGGNSSPHPFMFAGQMYAALAARSALRMSAGMQFREYHHVDDIAESVTALLSKDSSRPQLVELSSGRPVRLRELARAVFAHFGAEGRLSVGAQATAEAEVFENTYPCEGVIRWFEALGLSPAPNATYAGERGQAGECGAGGPR